MRLLIIEDDKELSYVMKIGLEKSGFTTDVANTGFEGEEKAFANSYDSILLDLNLPDKDGLEILSFLRENDIHTPIIIVSARDEVQQRALGLNSGADDYIIKPFDFVELEARIQAVIRRFYGRTKNEIDLGKIKVYPHTRKVFVGEFETVLSAKEFDILEYLASRSPDIVSSEDIVEHVYDEFYDPFSSVLRVHIANLRKKLTRKGGEGLLITIKGKGYQLCEKKQ
ncbi:response regulator transcription factor [Clostridium tagluense]|uniref:response regulator transcription factor n=1 Tax=Clostridium tagluense TaxID=360422 RepID=UPI001CF48288|nr:response regulator transcription factor [Clostridium tagluense]MCB2311465.1 response regulator transcription factor [Clostridium tagluense]MCB2316189.1 response regulator transcription factor [Clostridium tagluense]MCB2321007.1 response regulator transcription factor [Clostridium tagluense]MCB2326024.1 response regulator transcription factor [Clostridium tagluense]MCB2330747.1 response regulator transcription factor [Clostridium tagluense]